MLRSMTHPLFRSIHRSLAAACTIVAFTATIQAQAVSRTAPAITQTAAVEAKTVQRAAKPGDEGIKIHGHWSIVVMNRDGSVASRTEFENALLPEGANVMLKLLTGNAVPSNYMIALSPVPPASPCGATAAGVARTCYIFTTATDPSTSICQGNASCSYGLTTTTNQVLNTFQLKGSFTATAAGSLGRVTSLMSICTNRATGPAACANTIDGIHGLTGTDIAPIAVTVDQIVQVSVTLSFS